MKGFVRANKGFLLFMLLFGVFRTAVADWNPIPSSSMRPNLLEGDVVFVNRLAYNVKVPLTDIVLTRTGEPQRGDVVTFASPQDGTRLIKRVLALPGDRIEMRNERLVINGVESQYSVEEHVQEPGPEGTMDALRMTEAVDGRRHRIQVLPQRLVTRDFGPVVVPQDAFLMLGDNRDNSADSRYIGFVPRHLLIGRAERILVSADYQGNWLPRPERFGMSLR
ncbi:signal peptidase I [Massilia yuzhufengensis]|uniref:Signal peptidase I n=1 Tax=Massilia yuzhufengensis TaxID=1164594 RepID=A0A1I1JCV8_9BURK|nr:signal peptidase I [Massilia yuzhufengensis]SFC43270.1 signal peptidase I Serine peptidase. MEROPS family S26A [Massilia yuzhufengensis]